MPLYHGRIEPQIRMGPAQSSSEPAYLCKGGFKIDPQEVTQPSAILTGRVSSSQTPTVRVAQGHTSNAVSLFQGLLAFGGIVVHHPSPPSGPRSSFPRPVPGHWLPRLTAASLSKDCPWLKEDGSPCQ